eukprot:353094_1
MPNHCAVCYAPDVTTVCAACKCTYYCGVECQRTNWTKHKNSCKSSINNENPQIGNTHYHKKIASLIPLNKNTTIYRIVNEKELEYAEWLRKNPHLYSQERRNYENDVSFISTWNDYAYHASEGKIAGHFEVLTIRLKKRKLASISKCLHHKFGGIEQCIQNLKKILYGSPVYFASFAYEQSLCINCLLRFCVNKKHIEDIFNNLHVACTNWPYVLQYSNINFPWQYIDRIKEWCYLSNCLLKYFNFIKYTLANENLWMKILLSFVYYMTHFKKLLAVIFPGQRMISSGDQGYVCTNSSIDNLNIFEYNFCCILSCVKLMMPYFKMNHLLALIEMNYFLISVSFLNEYLNLEYIKRLIDCIVINTGEIRFRSSTFVSVLISVIQFINYKMHRYYKKTQDSKWRQKFGKIVGQIATTHRNFPKDQLHFGFLCRTEWFRWEKNKCFLNDEYKYSFVVYMTQKQPLLSVRTILKDRFKQIKKHKKCGNIHCQNKFNRKQLMLCSHCKLKWYCSHKCQKLHWLHHKPFCKPIN